MPTSSSDPGQSSPTLCWLHQNRRSALDKMQPMGEGKVGRTRVKGEGKGSKGVWTGQVRDWANWAQIRGQDVDGGRTEYLTENHSAAASWAGTQGPLPPSAAASSFKDQVAGADPGPDVCEEVQD